MELHNLKPAKGAIHKEKRIARGEGSGHGGTSGKGHKGMKARSGATTTKGFEGGQTPLQRRIPKFGFRNINRINYKEVNLDTLSNYAERYQVTEINQEFFNSNKIFNVNDKIKILGRGEITKAFKLRVHACTASAKTKIEAAGGSIELI
ncbi:MAG: 50S ribosomal protein L15 [Saprospiraceae bacterium]|jgi:large subunit ribosomal protein L15|nr:50S ribosomal protein L15 [Saprospiraceae bacterium]MBK7359131.1 50S ribosomal protein L15 [Saprospiraceae bacterium]MBK7737412.1 50S ribosomal protein L15 [Saprospiraceae bacterium]MBK7914008.1 50S ribosomal protein L15 [Saprospiraceae bacterium]MBK8296566.1 50S ribosomal protein L15 [Saprospiraceae bacterium]